MKTKQLTLAVCSALLCLLSFSLTLVTACKKENKLPVCNDEIAINNGREGNCVYPSDMVEGKYRIRVEFNNRIDTTKDFDLNVGKGGKYCELDGYSKNEIVVINGYPYFRDECIYMHGNSFVLPLGGLLDNQLVSGTGSIGNDQFVFNGYASDKTDTSHALHYFRMFSISYSAY